MRMTCQRSQREKHSNACERGTVASCLAIGAATRSRARRAATSWRRARSRSPSFSDVPTRGCRRRSSSTRAWATCLSSALPATSSPLLRSAASSSPRSGTARGSSWFWATPRCGAILATIEQLRRPTESQSRNLRSIVDRVRPSVEALLATELRHDPDALVRHAVRANVRVSANHLRHGSEVLEQLIQKRWAPRRRRRVFAGDRGRRVLRRCAGGWLRTTAFEGLRICETCPSSRRHPCHQLGFHLRQPGGRAFDLLARIGGRRFGSNGADVIGG